MLKPAHVTKHLPILPCNFSNLNLILSQSNESLSTGSSLWLSAQIMAMYLLVHLPKLNLRTKSVCELGSGVGFTALLVASLGYDVLATDLSIIVDSLLSPNITRNLPSLPSMHGNIFPSTLDWFETPKWNQAGLQPPFSLILSSDTVYSRQLVTPLLKTLHHVASISSSAKPLIILGIERRDPQLVDAFLAEAKDVWNFRCDKVRQKHIVQAMEKALGKDNMWDPVDYESVELWKLKLIV